MTAYAHISRNSYSFLWTKFGREMAERWFAAEEIARLPRFVRGKHKGEIKGAILWDKVERGGWVRGEMPGENGHVETRVGQVFNVRLVQLPAWGEPAQTGRVMFQTSRKVTGVHGKSQELPILLETFEPMPAHS